MTVALSPDLHLAEQRDVGTRVISGLSLVERPIFTLEPMPDVSGTFGLEETLHAQPPDFSKSVHDLTLRLTSFHASGVIRQKVEHGLALSESFCLNTVSFR